MPGESSPITDYLQAWNGGDLAARDELFAVVHAELYEMCQRRLRREHRSLTLSPTVMVNEVYMRFADLKQISLENRRPFFAFAAKLMRNILVDRARLINADKRSGLKRVDVEIAHIPEARNSVDVLALDDALSRLQTSDPLLVQIIELRFFSGLSEKDTAKTLGVSLSKVQREWRVGKRLLAEMLGGGRL